MRFAPFTAQRTPAIAIGFRSILDAVGRLSVQLPVILPLHPRTAGALEEHGLADGLPSNLRLVEPLGYLDMTMLQKNAALIATDSGGVQKEAFFHRVPCVTLREETEWTELVELGWNRLAPPLDPGAMFEMMRGALGTRGMPANPYGHGDASVKIVRILEREFIQEPASRKQTALS